MVKLEGVNPQDVGALVRVSDGTPRPPERFRKKVADWEQHNFDGVIPAPDCPSSSPGPDEIIVERPTRHAGVCRFFFHYDLNTSNVTISKREA